MTPQQRDAAQVEYLREYLAEAPTRALRRKMRELGRRGGKAKAARPRTPSDE